MIGSVQFEFRGQPVQLDLDDSLCWIRSTGDSASSEAVELFRRIAPIRQVTSEKEGDPAASVQSRRPDIGSVVVIGRHMLYQAASRVSGRVELHRDRQAVQSPHTNSKPN